MPLRGDFDLDLHPRVDEGRDHGRVRRHGGGHVAADNRGDALEIGAIGKVDPDADGIAKTGAGPAQPVVYLCPPWGADRN